MVTSGVGGIRWWRKPDIQQVLNLTKTQVDRLDIVFERERPERIALRRKIAEMDRLLRRILLRANAEDATVKRMSEQVEALRAQHNVRRTLMRFASTDGSRRSSVRHSGNSGEPMTRCGRDRRAIPTAES